MNLLPPLNYINTKLKLGESYFISRGCADKRYRYSAGVLWEGL